MMLDTIASILTGLTLAAMVACVASVANRCIVVNAPPSHLLTRGVAMVSQDASQ